MSKKYCSKLHMNLNMSPFVALPLSLVEGLHFSDRGPVFIFTLHSGYVDIMVSCSCLGL